MFDNDNLVCFRLGQDTDCAAEAKPESCELHWQVRFQGLIKLDTCTEDLPGVGLGLPGVVAAGYLVPRKACFAHESQGRD